MELVVASMLVLVGLAFISLAALGLVRLVLAPSDPET